MVNVPWDLIKLYVAIGVPTMLIAVFLSNYIDPLLIFGGTECGQAGPYGIKGCFGHPPAGIMIIGIGVAVFEGALYHAYNTMVST